ncbi:MAG: cyclic nucleotide-binding domain-containing protein [Gammaproteobacteria bacterium]
MSTESNIVTIELLKQLVPLAALATEQLEYLVTQTAIEKLAPGVCLFCEGEADRKIIYLLSGDILLTSESARDQIAISSKTSGGVGGLYYALTKVQPHRYTASATTDLEVICLDSDLIETMLAWSQFASREPEIIMSAEGVFSVDKSRWLQKMYRSPTFRSLPPANIEQLLDRLEPFKVSAGDVVIRQGDAGDYFYMIDEGAALVTRLVEDEYEYESIEIAQLSEGSSFGEAALISNKPRNATVSMLTDGVLLRLSKTDFLKLLKEPVLQWVTFEEGQEKAKAGARWLDVRLPSEFGHRRLAEAINIPVQELHRRIKELGREQHYICCCESGQRSSAAAFILGQYGLQASVLKGGLDNVPEENQQS